MLKLCSNGKIDLPFVTKALEQVLLEGRDGAESQVSDEVISNWCYEFYLSHRPHQEHESSDQKSDVYRTVALNVSTQWEADCGNTIGRVLSKEQFQAWLEALESACA